VATLVTEDAVGITGEDFAAVAAEELDGGDGGGVGFEGEVVRRCHGFCFRGL